MKKIEEFLVYALYLTLGTYAVPTLRLGDTSAVPYAVGFAFIIAGIVGLDWLLGRSRIRVPRRLGWGASIFAASIGISILFASQPNVALSLKYVLYVLSAVLIVIVATRPQMIEKTLICLAISSLAVFAYGAYGYFTGETGDPIQHSFGYFGVTYTDSTRNGDMLYFQTAFWIFGALFLFGERKRFKLVWLGLTGLIAIGIVMSLARGAWISTGFAFLLIIWQSGRVKRRTVFRTATILGLIGIFLASLFYLLNGDQLNLGHNAVTPSVTEDTWGLVTDRFNSIFVLSNAGGNSNQVRIDLTGKAIELALANPLGVGVGNARYYLTGIVGVEVVNHVENEYLQLLIEQGILGLGAYLALIAWLIGGGLRCAKAGKSPGQAEWVGWALTGIMINWGIYGVFNIMHESTWFWLVMGLAMAWLSRSAFDNPNTLLATPEVTAWQLPGK
jgi:O-antigen ligase